MSTPASRNARWYGSLALGLLLGGFALGALLVLAGPSACTGLFSIGCQTLMVGLGYALSLGGTGLGVVFAALGLRQAAPDDPKTLCRVALALCVLCLLGLIVWPLASTSPPPA